MCISHGVSDHRHATLRRHSLTFPTWNAFWEGTTGSLHIMEAASVSTEAWYRHLRCACEPPGSSVAQNKDGGLWHGLLG